MMIQYSTTEINHPSLGVTDYFLLTLRLVGHLHSSPT